MSTGGGGRSKPDDRKRMTPGGRGHDVGRYIHNGWFYVLYH